MKFYFICQLGYWLHALPELYFQKTKKVSVFFSLFRPWGYILFDFPRFFCIVLKNYILYY